MQHSPYPCTLVGISLCSFQRNVKLITLLLPKLKGFGLNTKPTQEPHYRIPKIRNKKAPITESNIEGEKCWHTPTQANDREGHSKSVLPLHKLLSSFPFFHFAKQLNKVQCTKQQNQEGKKFIRFSYLHLTNWKRTFRKQQNEINTTKTPILYLLCPNETPQPPNYQIEFRTKKQHIPIFHFIIIII